MTDLQRHGTKLFELKPANLVQAARADRRKVERNTDGSSKTYLPYAFHRAHVRRSDNERDLIGRALADRDRGLGSGKANTRMIYGDEELLRRALELVVGGALGNEY